LSTSPWMQMIISLTKANNTKMEEGSQGNLNYCHHGQYNEL